jgi:hypothetical protein
VFNPPIMMRARAASSMTATSSGPWGGDRRVDDGSHVDQPLKLLHAAGWCVGDTAFVTAAGTLIWLVSGCNGENVIRTEGLTQAAAWWAACDRTRAVGMLPGWRVSKPGVG